MSLELPAKEAASEKSTAPMPDLEIEQKIVTTKNEISVFEYTKQKIAFLIKDEDAFSKISDINYKDYQGKFVVYYNKVQKGRLFDFIENGDGTYRFIFPDGTDVSVSNFSEIDNHLLKIFEKRLKEFKDEN